MDELDAVDSRLIGLAEFLGIQCETRSLDRGVRDHADFMQKMVSDRRACFVVNPRVLQRWVGGENVPPELISSLVSRFGFIFVHGLRVESFDASMIAALSHGRLRNIEAIGEGEALYQIEKDTKDICETFSGLEFGPTNPVNDHVFGAAAPGLRTLISIGGRPFMTSMNREGTEILFLASEDVVDLDSPAGDSLLSGSFSRLVPQAMALRHIFGEECWRPGEQYACVIIDDPLLRRKYGFLNFEHLFKLVEKHKFHTSIAFIPHNYRRNSPQIIELFRNNGERLSICFHGSDHTEAELASTDAALLNTILRIAEMRMNRHEQKAGFACDKVMVFPQGAFSPEAMRVLKMRNFFAAVNTEPYPVGQSSPLTVRELIHPAILRYEGFPLFLRQYVKETQSQDIAFNLYFGKPILIVEHHEIFEHPDLLVDAVQKVNSLAPGIHWSGLERAVSNSVLRRRGPDGTQQVRAYSGKVRIFNNSNYAERFSIEWNSAGTSASVEGVLDNGIPCPGVEVNECGIRVLVEMPPLSSRTFSVIHRNAGAARESLGLRWNAKAFVRRRLSELRDNHLSRNPRLLSAARTLRERYLS
jgi:hypothetical protein